MKFFSHKSKSGFSLIEIVVSVSLFVIILVSTADIFRLVITGQRKAVASQNIQESLKYFLEATDKEIRMAKKEGGWCANAVPSFALGPEQTYNVVSSPDGTLGLVFRNFYDECVMYYLGNIPADKGRFMVRRYNHAGQYQEGPISPSKMNISNLNFQIANYNFPATKSFATSRPVVVVGIDAAAFLGDLGGSNYRELANIKMQTTLTSRYYR